MDAVERGAVVLTCKVLSVYVASVTPLVVIVRVVGLPTV